VKSIDKQINELRQALAAATTHCSALKMVEAHIFKAESFSDIQAAYKLTVGLEESLNRALDILNGEDA
tara:strand:- start:40 stop:243 length:204 start_codon:yes stop_codon:yes gene_type:complete